MDSPPGFANGPMNGGPHGFLDRKKKRAKHREVKTNGDRRPPPTALALRAVPPPEMSRPSPGSRKRLEFDATALSDLVADFYRYDVHHRAGHPARPSWSRCRMPRRGFFNLCSGPWAFTRRN